MNSPAVSTPSRASQLPQINSPMHSATAVRRLGVENDGDEKENGEGGGNGWGGKLFSPVLNYFADETEGGSEAQAEEDIQRRAQEELALQQQLAAQQEIEEVQMEEQDQQEEEEDDLEEFNPYLFIKHLPPYETVRIPGKICLPPKDKGDDRISLVLDLDEVSRSGSKGSKAMTFTTRQAKQGDPKPTNTTLSTACFPHRRFVSPPPDPRALHRGTHRRPRHGFPRLLRRRRVPGPRSQAPIFEGVLRGSLRKVRGHRFHR